MIISARRVIMLGSKFFSLIYSIAIKKNDTELSIWHLSFLVLLYKTLYLVQYQYSLSVLHCLGDALNVELWCLLYFYNQESD